MRTSYSDKKNGLWYMHKINDLPNVPKFRLHNHKGIYEILIFIKGNCRFCVEGTVYHMRPYDIVITQSTEMHMMCHNEPPSTYERIVINLPDSFFIRNGCEEFKKIFTNRPLGVNNLFPSEAVHKHHIPEIIKSIDEYIKENNSALPVVMKSKIVELLYNLNQISVTSVKSSFYDEQVKRILLYINDNIRSDLTLDSIASHFYISKYHLCHMFKQQTGLTVNKYITYKRILLVRELYAGGSSLIDASMEAGFGSYSNFYKMYLRETGESPKQDLKTNTGEILTNTVNL